VVPTPSNSGQNNENAFSSKFSKRLSTTAATNRIRSSLELKLLSFNDMAKQNKP
jgi:hypothetical protein